MTSQAVTHRNGILRQMQRVQLQRHAVSQEGGLVSGIAVSTSESKAEAYKANNHMITKDQNVEYVA